MQESKKESDRYGELADMETGERRRGRVLDDDGYQRYQPLPYSPPEETVEEEENEETFSATGYKARTRREWSKALHAVGREYHNLGHNELSKMLGESMTTIELFKIHALAEELKEGRPILDSIATDDSGTLADEIEKNVLATTTPDEYWIYRGSLDWETIKIFLSTSDLAGLHTLMEDHLKSLLASVPKGVGDASF